MVPDLLGAIFTVHGAAGFFFTNPHGGWEYSALWIVALVAVALIGDGAFALAPTPIPGETNEQGRMRARRLEPHGRCLHQALYREGKLPTVRQRKQAFRAGFDQTEIVFRMG